MACMRHKEHFKMSIDWRSGIAFVCDVTETGPLSPYTRPSDHQYDVTNIRRNRWNRHTYITTEKENSFEP